MVAHSWFRNLLITLKKPDSNASEDRIAVLGFEASGLMTKLMQLWQLLTDKQVARIREDIMNSVGIQKLVSEDEDYIARLICAEMTENLVHVAKDVARLSKKCHSPMLRSFELAFSDFIKHGVDPFGWLLPWKKIEKKVRKMEQFIVTNSNLYQEMEMLADMEQSFRRIKSNDSSDVISLDEYEKKFAWKQHVVKHLKEKSLWNRTYDYTVLLLARSVFSIYGRIGHVFGKSHVAVLGLANSTVTGGHNIRQSPSTILMQSSVYPFEISATRNSSISEGRPTSVSGPLSGKMIGVNFHSGPLRNTVAATSNAPSEKHSGFSFYSGPLKKLTVKSSSVSKPGTSPFRLWGTRDRSQDSQAKAHDGLAMASSRPTGYANGEHASPMSSSYQNSSDHHPQQVMDGTRAARLKPHSSLGPSSHGDPFKAALKNSKILNPPPETLGAAALALHYANLIVFIEKLVASPHLVGYEARNDLYSMLPSRIRIVLRSKLKPYAKSLTGSVCDTALAAEWNKAILRILEWLAPVAHNMIKWQSERSFEHQTSGLRTNVLLVQTLYFANQDKTEAVITELLIGLNYIWRVGREITAISLAGYASRITAADDYLDDD